MLIASETEEINSNSAYNIIKNYHDVLAWLTEHKPSRLNFDIGRCKKRRLTSDEVV